MLPKGSFRLGSSQQNAVQKGIWTPAAEVQYGRLGVDRKRRQSAGTSGFNQVEGLSRQCRGI
jgi:hypothetical protein